MSARPRKLRADVLLVDRGLAPSRAKAQALVMAGVVFSNDLRVDKPGMQLDTDTDLHVKSSGREYVSRGGQKLAGALEAFQDQGLCVDGVVAADFGASTGGFVDCLLQHGARRVHAIDVGHGLLHDRLRSDARVVVREKVNARYVTAEDLGERVDLVVIDASFISLSKLLGAASEVVRDGGELVALIKPQFEAGRQEVSRGRGVIRDEDIRSRVIADVLDQVRGAGFDTIADAPCVITGPKGNQEHFVYARKRAPK